MILDIVQTGVAHCLMISQAHSLVTMVTELFLCQGFSISDIEYACCTHVTSSLSHTHAHTHTRAHTHMHTHTIKLYKHCKKSMNPSTFRCLVMAPKPNILKS